MENIQHLSYDVWGTIVSVNPETKRLRSAFLADHFGVDPEEAHSIYSSLKASFDDVENNRAGYCKETIECYRLLVRKFNRDKPNNLYVEQEAAYVRSVFEEIFRKAPPLVSIELIGALRTLAARKKYTMSIGSNSNFIAGSVMRTYLATLIGPDIFKFAVHSDEIQWAKPNWRFFEEIKKNAETHCRVSHSRFIMHVGDSHECDLEGAKEAGLQSHIVRNPDETFQFVQELLQ